MTINELIKLSKEKFWSQNKILKDYPDLYKEIINKTEFLINPSFSMRKYCIEHNITSQPRCEVCNNIIIQFNPTIGFSRGCSKSCISKIAAIKNIEHNKNRTKEEWNKINKKIEKTCLEKYGYKRYGFSIPEVRSKIDYVKSSKNGINKIKLLRKEDKIWYNNWLNNVTKSNKDLERCKLLSNSLKNRSIEDKEKTKNKVLNTKNKWSKEYKNKVYNKISLNRFKTIISNYKDYLDPERFEDICESFNFNKKDIATYFSIGEGALYPKFHAMGFSNYLNCQSHYEVEISDLLTELNINFKRNDRTTIKPLELDFYLPDYKLAIEFNGSWFHSINSGKLKNYHQEKSKACKEKGIRLIHIYEDEWNNSLKQKIIKDILLSALGLLENRIYARKCIVKEIDSKSYKQFCEYNHLQGYRVASIRLGLFYNDELVQIASFSKSKHHDKNFEYEWIRGCPASNSTIIGGTSKLWKYFIKKYNPKSVLCYADFNKFDGKGYKECGFDFIKLTSPDKFYIDNYGNRINRNPTHYKEYKELVNDGELLEIHGSGSLRFEYIKK